MQPISDLRKTRAANKLLDRLNDLGVATYHHHNHNAIVGKSDQITRYNDKWADCQRTIVNNDALGSVHNGAFLRGQGGIFTTLSRPYNIDTASDLFINAEEQRTLIDLGVHDRWKLDKA